MQPTRTPRQVFEWGVAQAVTADQAGFSEYWVGEHATLQWESIPSPELVIAAAAVQTSRIKLGPLAHLLPYHNPATLAVQTAWLAQICEGRYQLGIAAGAYHTDAALRGITDMSVNHKMLFEAIEIIEKVWAGKEYQEQGQFWKHGFPHEDPIHPVRDIRPPGGRIQMAMTGLSPDSPSISFAGANGYIPVSIYSGDAFVRNHWAVYSAAATAHGHPVDRAIHRVVRDVVVADTDAEAKKFAIEGGLGEAWEQYLAPTYKRFGVMEGLLADPSHNVQDVDAAYLAEHVWITGSPETVTQKINDWQGSTGGFGTLLIYGHDYLDDSKPWDESMHRLAQEVAPKITVPS
ncbi:MAG TPA: LLM class flavin-dependent oxidoreductase [Sporichthyaceae bacterium]|jgi:alkanesulfonate monooxygenase SsuD/methylene tetrahydromethanopterin reductase-like flavin-dependent oxidoreductase (luciferase family)|nr:LLM class flavin-dependent oxidoreductase [Sporichthyaceae bacterium]